MNSPYSCVSGTNFAAYTEPVLWAVRHFQPRIPLHLAVVTIAGLLLIVWQPLAAQQEGGDEIPKRFILDSVEIHTIDVFENGSGLPWVDPLLIAMHTRTRERTVREEVFFQIGDTLTRFDLQELEKNLRDLGIFASIDISTVIVENSEAPPYCRLVIRTSDAWTLLLSATYGHSSDQTTYGASVQEINFAGRAKRVGVSAQYTTLNDRGWNVGGYYRNPNIFGTHINLGGAFATSEVELGGNFYLGRPFFSDRTRDGFQAAVVGYDGRELVYPRGQQRGTELSIPLKRISTGGWYARSNAGQGDVFRGGISVDYDRTIRDSASEYRRAFENSVSVFLGLSSVRRRYVSVLNADFMGERLIPIGAFGSASIGKISPVYGGLDNVVYVGGDLGQATMSGNFYGYASVAAGTALAGQTTAFTTFRVHSTGGWLFDPLAVVARLDQSTVWRWGRYLLAPIGNADGLRGYRRSDVVGDNRMVFNLEFRVNPLVNIWIFDIGAVAFYDVAAAWDQSAPVSAARFHSSVGAGLRFSYARAAINKGLLRIDLAYNFDEHSFAKVIVGTQEAFDLFGTIDYRPPAPYTY